MTGEDEASADAGERGRAARSAEGAEAGRRAEAEAEMGRDAGARSETGTDEEAGTDEKGGTDETAGNSGADGRTAPNDGEAPTSFFREGLRNGRDALEEFLRGFRAAGERAPLASRLAGALTAGVGLSYVYEYFVVVVAALAGQPPTVIREALTIEVSTQALLLFLVMLVYVDLFVTTVALNRSRQGHAGGEARGFEGERRRERSGVGLSRGWWLVNLLVGAAAGYMLLASFGPLVAGVGAGLGLFGGDELYRRGRSGGR